MLEVESIDLDIDGVHINKKFKLSHQSETEEDCMIVGLVPESITHVSYFNIEKIP